MTSRGKLTIVSLLVFPLVLEATSGCDYFVGLSPHPLSDNALRCDCRCADTGSRTLAIMASSDDAEQTDAGAVTELTGPDLDVGERIVALRFAGAAIPAGAEVLNAYVQFSAEGNTNLATEVVITGELSANAPTFAAVVNSLSDRATGVSVPWVPPAWVGGTAGDAQRTPELKTVLQELVDLPDWTSASPIVLIFKKGLGQRAARSFDGSAATPARKPTLFVTYDAGIAATIPMCATADVDHDEVNAITAESQEAQCALAQQTFTGLAAACGYPSSCSCTVVDVDVPGHDNSFHSTVCEDPCDPVPVDDTCTNFDPNSFSNCLEDGGSLADCIHFVAATNAGDDTAICVNSGSPLAFHMYGRRSLCELAGTADIKVGDREPEKNPHTEGTLEILGGPCAGGGCNVHPYFDLLMHDITFEVKWHSDPTFFDLSASGRGLDTTVLDGVNATFGAGSIDGTGNGRRIVATPPFVRGLAIPATNDDPLIIGIDWAAYLCDMTGNVAHSVDGEVPDGVCENDDSIPCTADSPDCDDVGGVCLLEDEDIEPMLVDVILAGKLANQPPTADAGADQEVECTSADGASFLLDGRGSSDPDQDLALASWRSASRIGPVISDDLIATQALGLNQSGAFVLRVIDSHAQTSEDTTTAEVVDTTPPVIACNLPATITPPKTPLTFTATAEDVCDTGVTPESTGLECYKFNRKGERVDVPCRAATDGDSIVILNSIGVGTHIDWHVGANDDSDNASAATCQTLVVNPIRS